MDILIPAAELNEIQKKTEEYNMKAKMLGTPVLQVTDGILTGMDSDCDCRLIIPSFIRYIEKFKEAKTMDDYSEIKIHSGVKEISGRAFIKMNAESVTVIGNDACRAFIKALSSKNECMIKTINLDSSLSACMIIKAARNMLDGCVLRCMIGKDMKVNAIDKDGRMCKFDAGLEDLVHYSIMEAIGMDGKIRLRKSALGKNADAVIQTTGMVQAALYEVLKDSIKDADMFERYACAIDAVHEAMVMKITQISKDLKSDYINRNIKETDNSIYISAVPFIWLAERIIHTDTVEGMILNKITEIDKHSIKETADSMIDNMIADLQAV